jgi:NADH:ubiquinone oxidoreductase subunit 3 (subunit A)
MMEKILFSPPAAFIIILLIVGVLAWLCSYCAFRKRQNPLEAEKPYACGENFEGYLIQPDYSQFFPFAFFFTILHIVALVIATVPTETVKTLVMAITYIIGAITGLVILLRK